MKTRQILPIKMLTMALVLGLAGAFSPSSNRAFAEWSKPANSLRSLSKKIWRPKIDGKFAGKVLPPSFRLALDPNQNLDLALEVALKPHFLPPTATLLATRDVVAKFKSGKEASTSRDYAFMVGDLPLCGYSLRAHKISGIKNPFILGEVPRFEVHESFNRDEWPLLAGARGLAANQIADQGYNADDGKLLASRKCLYLNDGALAPAWEMTIAAADRQFFVTASDSQLFDSENRFFDVSGTAQAYEKNPVHGVLKTFILQNLIGDGTMENDYFTTTATNRAEEDDEAFVYPTSDSKFDEASLFVHANLQNDWFQEMGYEWAGDDKINIVVHAVIEGGINNALYTPASGSAAPRIQVGDGDGDKLQNLPKDGDVVSHELGHHIIFDSLQSVKGESLVIHEGMADFFTFARTGDPCLGESICPAGSPVGCEIDGECLRTADNNYIYGQNTKSEAHFKSQFISAMLWDVRGESVPEEKLDKIAVRGVSLLQASSGYHDLILGFLLADQELYDGKYCSTLFDAAVARGLGDHIADIDCDDLPSDGFNELNSGDSPETTRSTAGDDGLFPWCGILVAGNALQSSGQLALVLLILLLPIIGTLPKLKPQKAKHHARRNTRKPR